MTLFKMLGRGYVVMVTMALLGCTVLGTELHAIDEQSVIVTPFQPTLYREKGSRLVVDCDVVSQSPILDYEWFKNGERVHQQKRVYTATNGSLIFGRLVSKKLKSDRGHYECYARNEFGTVIGRQVDIHIEEQTSEIEPKTLEAVEGGIARFKCYVSPASTPTSYLWAFKEHSLKTDGPNGRIFMSDGILQIYNVTSEDEGLYYCTAFKNLDDADFLEASAFLKIKSGPLTKESRLLNIPHDITVINQEPALLECLVQGQEPVTISWRYPNGSRVVPNQHVTVSGASNLRISRSSKNDFGPYMCIVGHTNGSETKHAYTLSVLAGPEFEKIPQLVQHNVIAQRTRLPCIVTGNPTPDITWYKDGLRIYPAPGLKILNELVLHGTFEESGYYQCVASNSMKTIITSSWVNFKRKASTPGEVKDVDARALSATNVSLKWSSAQTQDAFQVMAYVIHYHELHDFLCPGRCTYLYERQLEVSPTTSLIINGLKPFTKYSFNIQGYSAQGAGMLSKPAVVQTLESVPSSAPNVKISPDSPTSFRISWTEVPKSERNGIITQYKVSVDEADIKRTVIKVKGSQMEHLETGVEPGKEYKVQVLAGTSVGFPNINDNWVPYRTPLVENGDIPTPDLVFKPINSSSVLISWNNDNYSNTGSYRIMVKELLESVPIGRYNLSGTASECLVTGLENKVFYEIDFMVKGRTTNSVKTVKELYQSLAPGDLPEPPPPMVVKPEPLSSTQIMLQWEEPKSSLSITKYTIRYQQRIGEEMINRDEMSNFLEVKGLSAVINNLQPYTWYFISVRSHTDGGAGPYSRPVLIQTLEGIPSPPENVLAEVVSPGTVKLKWGPPSKQNGVITYYIIYYNSDRNVPDNSWNEIHQNGTTTMVVVEDLVNKVYYFKLRACTNAGESQSTDIIEIHTVNCDSKECAPCKPPNACGSAEDDNKIFGQRLGIVIGCAIGLVCIILCSIFVVIRHRQLRARYQNRGNVHLINTSNGQNIGLYLSQSRQPVGGPVSDTSYSPILSRLPENENSDSKGGDECPERKHGRVLSHDGSPRIFARGLEDSGSEHKALLSTGTSSSSQSNDTSDDFTPDMRTQDSSCTSPEVESEISYSGISDCRTPDRAINGAEKPPFTTRKHLDDSDHKLHRERDSNAYSVNNDFEDGLKILNSVMNITDDDVSNLTVKESSSEMLPHHQDINC